MMLRRVASVLLPLCALALSPRPALADDEAVGAPAAGAVGGSVPASEPDDDDEPEAAVPKLDAATLAAARETLVHYLDFVKAKKWKEARSLTHPLTLKTIEQVAKRLGAERHSMAPWYWAKENFYLKSFKIVRLNPAAHGTVVAETSEDSYQIQEKGDFAGEKAAYLLAPRGGRWYVVDKKSEADGFSGDSLKYGYPGYFDDAGPKKR